MTWTSTSPSVADSTTSPRMFVVTTTVGRFSSTVARAGRIGPATRSGEERNGRERGGDRSHTDRLWESFPKPQR